jgi:inhibitor of KinA
MFEIKLSGDSAIIVSAGEEISPEINLKIRKLLRFLEDASIEGITDFIPAYTDLMICYDPLLTDLGKLKENIHEAEKHISAIELAEPSVFCIPVLYGGEEGPDLLEVARLNNLSEQEVIDIHSSRDYLVYMLGFTPGFCYLGGLDKRISAPRKEDPRIRIPSGSVGIAGEQTGIYPIESPGGWQLIGKTPVRFFDPVREPVFLVNAGDYIRFFPINKNEFERIQEDVTAGIFKVEVLNRTL